LNVFVFSAAVSIHLFFGSSTGSVKNFILLIKDKYSDFHSKYGIDKDHVKPVSTTHFIGIRFFILPFISIGIKGSLLFISIFILN